MCYNKNCEFSPELYLKSLSTYFVCWQTKRIAVFREQITLFLKDVFYFLCRKA